MKVNIGPYINFIGPYQIADKIFFWVEKYPVDDSKSNRWDYKAHDWLGEFLAHGGKDYDHDTWLNKLLNWIHSKRKRKVKIKLDRYDTWNVDSTLSLIVLPLLKQLKETRQGSGFIDLEDVPEQLRCNETEEYDPQQCFDFYRDAEKLECDVHTRYEWALNEMIWAFEQLQPDCDWEDQYWITHPEIDFAQYPEDEGKITKPLRWKVEGRCDWDGRKKHQERIDNGLRLFGCYYQTLWD